VSAVVTVIEERWVKLQGLSLKHGSHSPDSTFCVMEAVAFVAGEKWSDAPECACPVISAFLRSWNDALPTDADRDRLLKSLIPRLVNTRNKKLETKRSLMAADWLVRVHTPAWLRLAGLIKQAESLEQLPEIISTKQAPSIRGPIEAVRDDASAARAAAGVAASDAARDAAWVAARAAAGVAAGDAAWVAAGVAAARAAAGVAAARAAAGVAAWAAAGVAARAAARAAAGVAARAAAGDAAWAAAGVAARAAARAAAWVAARAAARAKLAPTVANLQESALQLVERMIEAK
jgi:hypothetical protein